MRTIKTCAGIGDSAWILMKLVHANEQFHFQLPSGFPQRGKQIFDLLPSVAASCEYLEEKDPKRPIMTYEKIKRANIQNRFKNWYDIKEQDFYLSANKHLEDGKRIETFLPDLPTSFRIEWATSQEDKDEANRILAIFLDFNDDYIHDGEFVGIYFSSYAGSRNFGTWGAKEWIEFVEGFYKKNPSFIFVIIGAPWDNDMSTEVMNGLGAKHIPFINTIGRPLGVVLEILKRQVYFCGFPSGLSILNETLGKPTFMFYAEKIKGIMNTWADPERIQNGNYKGCLFCPPEKALSWIFNDYKLLDKI